MDIKPEGFANRKATEFRKDDMGTEIPQYITVELTNSEEVLAFLKSHGVDITGPASLPSGLGYQIFPAATLYPSPPETEGAGSAIPKYHPKPLDVETFYTLLESHTSFIAQLASIKDGLVTFDQALLAMKAGKRVSRVGWVDKAIWVEIKSAESTLSGIPYFSMYSPKEYIRWTITHGDVLADDWVVLP